MSLDAVIRVVVGSLEVAATFTVAKHSVLSVVGPNGSGKTTLLRALAGFEPLHSGRIVLDDQVLDDPDNHVFSEPRIRPATLMPQDLVLFPSLNVVGNVAFGLRAHGRTRSEARREALRWLEKVGMADRATSRISELSGGEEQRVCLARTLAPRPDLVLLDEPMAALDAQARRDMRLQIKEVLGSTQATGVVVTHDLEDARVLSDHIVVLEGGRITQTGSYAQICDAPATPYVVELVKQRRARGRDHSGRNGEIGDG